MLVAGLHVAAVNLQLLGTFSFRFGHGVRTISGLFCDECLLCWWEPGNFHNWYHAFADGSKARNLSNLGHSEDIAFVQFLLEDGVAISRLRKLNADVSNIGRVHEPRMPLIREIPLEIASENRPTRISKTKSITDDPNRPVIPDPTRQPYKSPEVYELPPDNSGAEDVDLDVLPDEGQPTESEEVVGWVCSAEPPMQPCLFRSEANVFVVIDDNEPAELL